MKLSLTPWEWLPWPVIGLMALLAMVLDVAGVTLPHSRSLLDGLGHVLAWLFSAWFTSWVLYWMYVMVYSKFKGDKE